MRLSQQDKDVLMACMLAGTGLVLCSLAATWSAIGAVRLTRSALHH